MNQVSSRYLGQRGREYFGDAGRFTGVQDFGRIWQSRHFAPYCGNESVVLDFGCGDGTILRALPAARRLAVEVNPHCIERIEGFNARSGPSIEVRPSIDEWGSEIADVAISNHALEHVIAPDRALRGVLRVLKPGGMLVLVTPYDDWRGRGQRDWVPGDRQCHLYTWTPLNIGNLLAEVGFEVVSSRLATTAWSPRMFWLDRWFGRSAFALGCTFLSRVVQRREVVSIARRSTAVAFAHSLTTATATATATCGGRPGPPDADLP
jgi:SAM-dependent methyltransferase